MNKFNCKFCGKEVTSKRAKLYCGRICGMKAYHASNPKKYYPVHQEFRSDKQKPKFVNESVFDWREYPEGVLI